MEKAFDKSNVIMNSFNQENALKQKSQYLWNKYCNYLKWENLSKISLLMDPNIVVFMNQLSDDKLKIDPEQITRLQKDIDKLSDLSLAYQDFSNLTDKKKKNEISEEEKKQLEVYQSKNKENKFSLSKIHLFDILSKFQSFEDKNILNYLLNGIIVLNDEYLYKKITNCKKNNEGINVQQKISRNESDLNTIVLLKKTIKEDFSKYLSYQESIKNTSKEKAVEKKLISRNVIEKIKKIFNADKKSESDHEIDLETFDDDDLPPQLQLKRKKIIEEKKHPLYKETSEIADKILFLDKILKTFRKTNYVLSLEDQSRVENIISHMNKNEIIFLSGETGSGKTELAILIAEIIADKKLEKEKDIEGDYVIIGGAKATDLEDFTLERVVTSRKITGSSKEDLVTSGKINIKKEIIDSFFQRKELKESIIESCKKEEKAEIEQYLDTIDHQQYNLFTEYHIKGLFKAMYYGLPLIIDEMNAIRPEVLIGLNHFFTRKIGQKIQLPNGLGEISVKKGFCIICTGNDTYQHLGTRERYTQGRYILDEATMNRFTSIAKDYHKQAETLFVDTDNISDNIPSYINYMKQNEMYGVLLALLFTDAKQKNKFGVELMKHDFIEDGKSDNEHKKELFEKIKNFAIAINKIQYAFSGKQINLTNGKTIDLSVIKRKVISMRDIRKILDDYKSSPFSLDYHIYKNYIRSATNEVEKYALIRIFADFGFFESLCSDSEDETLAQIEVFMENERKKGGKITAMEFGKEKIVINPKLIANKLILSKDDLYEPYFGKEHTIDDNKFNENIVQEDIKDIKDNETYKKIEEETEISEDMIQDLANVVGELINNKIVAQNLNILEDIANVYIFEKKIEGLKNNKVIYDKNKIVILYKILTQISDMFERLIGNEIINNAELQDLIMQLNNIV